MDVDSERYGDEDGAYRNPSLRVGAGDTGRRYADIGRQVVDSESGAHTGGHLACDVAVHGAVKSEQAGVDSQQAVLEPCVIGNDSAAYDSRSSRSLDELGNEQSTRKRLGDGDGEPTLDQGCDYLCATQDGRP